MQADARFSYSLDSICARVSLHQLNMICEDCHQNEAAYRLIPKKDDVSKAKVLCEDCAERYRPELSKLSEGEQFELLHKLDDEESHTQTTKWVVPKNNPPEIPPP